MYGVTGIDHAGHEVTLDSGLGNYWTAYDEARRSSADASWAQVQVRSVDEVVSCGFTQGRRVIFPR